MLYFLVINNIYKTVDVNLDKLGIIFLKKEVYTMLTETHVYLHDLHFTLTLFSLQKAISDNYKYTQKGFFNYI